MKRVNAFQFGEDIKLFRETAEEQAGAAAFGGRCVCMLLHPDKDMAELKEVQQRRMETDTAEGNLLYTENFGDRLLQETGKAVTIKQ